LVTELRAHVNTLRGDVARLEGELAHAQAIADRSTAELVELARRLAAIAETKAEPKPPRRRLGRAMRWFLRN
jgi:hypothetical protein